MPWVPTTMYILVDSRLKNEVYMHYVIARVWVVKIYFPNATCMYMHYFLLSLMYVKIILSPNVTCELTLNNEIYLY